MQHLLVCPMMNTACSTQDLTTANGIATGCARHWEGTICLKSDWWKDNNDDDEFNTGDPLETHNVLVTGALSNNMLTYFLLNRLLLAAPTWLCGRCGRHNSPPASSIMNSIYRRSDGSHVSAYPVHPSLLRSSSFSSPSWYHLQSISSDVFLVSPLYVAKPQQSCYHVILCYVLYFQSLPRVIVSHMVS